MFIQYTTPAGRGLPSRQRQPCRRRPSGAARPTQIIRRNINGLAGAQLCPAKHDKFGPRGPPGHDHQGEEECQEAPSAAVASPKPSPTETTTASAMASAAAIAAASAAGPKIEIRLSSRPKPANRQTGARDLRSSRVWPSGSRIGVMTAFGFRAILYAARIYAALHKSPCGE